MSILKNDNIAGLCCLLFPMLHIKIHRSHITCHYLVSCHVARHQGACSMSNLGKYCVAVALLGVITLTRASPSNHKDCLPSILPVMVPLGYGGGLRCDKYWQSTLYRHYYRIIYYKHGHLYMADPALIG